MNIQLQLITLTFVISDLGLEINARSPTQKRSVYEIAKSFVNDLTMSMVVNI